MSANSKPFRVTIDARFSGVGGIGTYLDQLIPRLAQLRSHWTLHALGRMASLRERPWSGLANVRLVPCDARVYSVAEQWALLRSCPDETDVFWSPHYNIPVLLQRPLVVTIHDVCHLARPEATTSAAQRAYARFMHRRVAARASAVLCDSAFTESELRRLVPGVRGDVRVALIGVDDAWFEARTLARPASESGPYLVYVGNLKRHKNVPAMLRAFGQVMDAVPHRLLIVGHTEGMNLDPDVQSAAAALGARVRFVGGTSAAELRAYVAYADALITASLYEGFGLPPLEAMAAGTPCLVSRAGSLPEVCGDSAMYCDPTDERSIADGIVRIVRDTETRDALRRTGVARARTFSWDRCADATAAALESVGR